MSEKPDYQLDNAKIPVGGEEPKIYAVSDLKSFVKPDLDEELTKPVGGAAVCGTEVVCGCVPVDTCVCNVVSYHVGGESGGCQCVGNVCCAGLYWYPS